MHEDIDQLDLFIGSNHSYEVYKRENKIQEPEESNDGSRKKQADKKDKPTVTVLSKSTLKPISEEMLTILKRTRCAHEYTEVYMQSSLDFYDEFYNDTEISPELKAVRQIRRVYKNYADYLTAIEVRNQYIDTLVEKYGGEIEFQKKLSMGLVRDWIPSMPTLSKRSDDYEMYLSGMVPTTVKTQPEGTILEILKSMQENVEDLVMEEDFGIETSIGVVREYNEFVDSTYYDKLGYDRKGSTVSISDLEELNKVFKSWYKSDGGDSEHREFFKNAPENIRKRFYNYCSFNEPGLLARIGRGEEIEESLPDPNEMVRDSVTGKSMTRRELEQRETIRLLAKNGWSESRLLNYYNVGSSLERMARKKKASKKRRKRSGSANELFDAMNSPEGIDPTYAENDYLSQAFMDIMRGD